jgi:Chaperone of endosialidase
MKNSNQNSPILLTVLLFILIAVNVGQAQSSSANSISFQGALIGAGGQPLVNGNYNLTFKFYDVPTGGTALATSNVPNVPVAGGLASTPIPVDAAWFNSQTRYLGIAINGGAELSPRVLITAMPYAMRATKAGDADGNLSLDGWLRGERGIYGDGPTQGEFGFAGGYREGVFPNWLGSGANADCVRVIGDGNRHAGYGVAQGSSIESPVIWFYAFEDRNCFQVRAVDYLQRVADGTPLLTVRRRAGAAQVGINTETPSAELDVRGTARMTVCQITSDRAAKDKFTPACLRDVLAKLATVPISTWVYTNNPSIRHIGPVAQDFHAAFGLGEDDKHIATVDADGVALAAIQGLHQLLEEKETRIAALEKELIILNSDLSTRLAALEELATAQHAEASANAVPPRTGLKEHRGWGQVLVWKQ